MNAINISTNIIKECYLKNPIANWTSSSDNPVSQWVFLKLNIWWERKSLSSSRMRYFTGSLIFSLSHKSISSPLQYCDLKVLGSNLLVTPIILSQKGNSMPPLKNLFLSFNIAIVLSTVCDLQDEDITSSAPVSSSISLRVSTSQGLISIHSSV